MLDYLNKTNAESRSNMLALMEHVDERGFHPSKTRYRPISGPLVELKVKNPKAIRIIAYKLPPGRHVLLLGFDKEDGPIPPDVMKRAKRMATDFEQGGMRLDG